MSAFTVSDPVEGVAPDQIKFTREITNIGGHYSVSSGVFTCQYPGLYVFVVHLTKNRDTGQAYCWLRKNDFEFLPIQSTVNYNSFDSYFVSSNSVILKLNYGDRLDFSGCTNISTIYPGTETSFTGFLLTTI